MPARPPFLPTRTALSSRQCSRKASEFAARLRRYRRASRQRRPASILIVESSGKYGYCCFVNYRACARGHISITFSHYVTRADAFRPRSTNITILKGCRWPSLPAAWSPRQYHRPTHIAFTAHGQCATRSSLLKLRHKIPIHVPRASPADRVSIAKTPKGINASIAQLSSPPYLIVSRALLFRKMPPPHILSSYHHCCFLRQQTRDIRISYTAIARAHLHAP